MNDRLRREQCALFLLLFLSVIDAITFARSLADDVRSSSDSTADLRNFVYKHVE